MKHAIKKTPDHAHHAHLNKTMVTILLAIAFLSFVMLLSYLFITGTLQK